MADLRGKNGTRVVGKPYTVDGVFTDDIRVITNTAANHLFLANRLRLS